MNQMAHKCTDLLYPLVYVKVLLYISWLQLAIDNTEIKNYFPWVGSTIEAYSIILMIFVYFWHVVMSCIHKNKWKLHGDF